MSKIKLRPCPFCGGKADILIVPGYFEKEHSGWVVKCLKGCVNQMPYRSEVESREAWNRRITDADNP